MEAQCEGFRCSPQQARLWNLCQASPGAHHAQCALLLAGPLDAVVLKQALEDVVECHESLRTTVLRCRGMSFPLQMVSGETAVDWCRVDTETMDGESGPRQALAAELGALADCAPPVRAALIEAGEERNYLILTLPALHADANSLNILAVELRDSYARRRAGGGDKREAPVQYVQFSEWQNELLGEASGQSLESAERWDVLSRSLAGELRPRLPLEQAPKAEQAFAPASVAIELDAQARDELTALAERSEVPVTTLLFAGWQILVARLTQQSDLGMVTVLDERPAEDLEEVIGPLAKVVPIRCRVRPRESLLEVARRVRESLDEAWEWEEEFLVDTEVSGCAPAELPILFEAREWVSPLPVGDLRFELFAQSVCLEPFKLALSVLLDGERWLLKLRYDSRLIDDNEAARLAGRFTTLVAAAARRPGYPVGGLEILAPGEERWLLDELQGPALTETELVTRRFERQAEETPGNIAVVFEDQQLTYLGLATRANRLAHYLRALGAGPGRSVGIALERSPAMITAVWAVLKAGAAYVVLDPSHPARHLVQVLEDAEPIVVLAGEASMQKLSDAAGTRAVVVLNLEDEEAVISGQPASNPVLDLSGADLAYVLFTSGSTGRPKGVMVTHGGLANYLAWSVETYAVASGLGAPVHSALGFDLTVTSLFSPLLVGGRVVLVPEAPGAVGLGRVLCTAQEAFSLVKVTPAHLQTLAETLPASAAGRTAVLVVGGEALSAERLAFWRRHSPGIRIVNEYGPTETVVGCCAFEVPGTQQAGEDAVGPVAIGRPIDGTRAYVVDARGRLAPFGAVGELWIGGAGVARGYLKAPRKSAERFVPDPFGPADGRLYRTGDLARYRADGQLVFVGRNDHQVKVRGFRIEPGEIEAALESHSAVAAAVVVARTIESGARALVAYVVPRKDDETDFGAPELKEHLAALLPQSMIPGVYVTVDEMPLTRNGKVDRERLPAPAEAGARSPRRRRSPRTPREGRLVALWEEVLHQQGIAIDDNFFDLGGDSIRAVRLVSRINDELGTRLDVPDVFRYQTIAQLDPFLTETAHRLSAGEAQSAGDEQIELLRSKVLADENQRGRLVGQVEDFFPLSGIERGMAYYSLLMPDEPVYHDQFTYLLNLADPRRFFAVFRHLVKRHDILRSGFDLFGFQEPLKLVYHDVDVEPDLEDLSALCVEKQRSRIEAYRRHDLARRFAFEGVPPWRLKLFRLAGDLHAVVWSWHHAILDGWSNHSLWMELDELCRGVRELDAAPLASSYRNYLAVTLGRREVSGTAAFWRETLAHHERGKLPFNRSQVRDPEARGMITVERPLSADLLETLRSTALEHHVSMQSLCLAAHLCLLHVITAEDDVTTGLVTHDRPALEDADKMLGCFLNTVPVRIRLTGFESAAELVREVHAYRIRLREHEIPLVDVAALIGARDTGDNPIFDTIFNFMDFHVVEGISADSIFAPMRDGELRNTYQFDSHEMTNTLFDVEVSTTLDNFLARLKYSPRLFSPAEAATALDLFERILEAFGRDLSAPFAAERLLTEAEREELVERFNDTATPYPRDVPLHRFFERQAQRTPHRSAVLCAGREISYLELDRRANRLAHFLIAQGVEPGESVGVVCERSIDLAAALLAVLKAGAAYVPIEPDHPVARKTTIARKSGIRRILAARGYELAGGCPVQFCVIPDSEVLETWRDTAPTGRDPRPEDLAYTIYTSGSTGEPKGVMIEHHSAVNLIHWVNREYPAGTSSRILMLSSVCFDLSVYDLFGGLAAGATVVIPRTDDLRDPERLWRLVSDERVSFWSSVPSTMNHLVKHLEIERPEYRDSGLKVVFLSGDWIPVSLPERLRRFFPEARVVSLGGATEATVWSNYYPIGEVDPAWASIPYGRPIDNNAFYVLDGEQRLVPRGVVGELYIGGVGVARGYAGDPEKTARAFVADRFSRGRFATSGEARMYRTGDLGRMRDDGNLEFLGRADHQVKIRGFRVELGEIESQMRKHAEVREAVVVDHVDHSGEKFLCAFVVSAGTLETAELRRYLALSLPEYMIPATFVALSELPLTANGKIDRRALPRPGVEDIHTSRAYLAPINDTEAALVGIWEEVLGITGIGTGHDFFELGGHSLSAVLAVSRIRRDLGYSVTLRELFEAGTIAVLARRVESRSLSVSLPEPRKRLGGATTPTALSSGEERFWILQQLDPTSSAFTLGGAIRLTGPLDIAAFVGGLNEVLKRHDSLRTNFREIDGVPARSVAPPAWRDVALVDLADLPAAVRQRETFRLAEADLRRPFDLARDHLLRVKLVRLGDGEHAAFFGLHHIVGDGWSLGLLVRELGDAYEALVSGAASPLPELPVQYADYVEWQKSVLTDELVDEQLAYWRSQLAGPLPVLKLAGQRRRPAKPRFRGAVEHAAIPAALVSLLVELGRRREATLFMVLLSAFKTLLYHYTDERDVVVGTNVAHRDAPEFEGLIGMFVNNLALRSDLGGEPTFLELLERVRSVCLEAFDHQDVPFEKVIGHIHPQRYGNVASIFQAMFLLQNFPSPRRRLHEIWLQLIELPMRTANFDLTLMISEKDSGLVASFIYDTDLFSAETVARMAENFKTLLQHIASSPDRVITDLAITEDAEVLELAESFSGDF